MQDYQDPKFYLSPFYLIIVSNTPRSDKKRGAGGWRVGGMAEILQLKTLFN